MRPQVHHDLCWELRDEFAMHGLDVNQRYYRRTDTGEVVELGRWVEGNGRVTPDDPYGVHQSWSGDFRKEWEAFFEAEKTMKHMWTRDEVIDKMMRMRNSGRYGSKKSII